MDAALHGDRVTALGQHGLRSRDKLARIPVKVVPVDGEALPEPPWLHARPMMSETVAAMAADLREHQVDVLTIGQYLAPSRFHLPVRRYVPPHVFAGWRDAGLQMGFCEVVAGPLVRSSYHADQVALSA